MKNLFPSFIAIAIIIFLVACSNEDLILEENTEPKVEGYTLSLTASMPNDEPPTRVGLERDGKNINLTWLADYHLQFAIVQGENKYREGLSLLPGNISNDGKTVDFNLTLPDATKGFDKDEPFDVYGLYGLYDDGPIFSLSDDNYTNVILTKDAGSMGTLSEIQYTVDVMLYFKETGIDLSNPPTSVTFKHLGSLFAINIHNDIAPPSSTPVTQARLVGVDDNGVVLTEGNWAYNNGAGGKTFDLLTEEFQDTTSGGNYISFTTAGRQWIAGTTTILWGWYPPLPNKAWPALRLQMTNNDGVASISSLNFKPARASAPLAGKAYHFYAKWDGTDLVFTDDTFTISPPALN